MRIAPTLKKIHEINKTLGPGDRHFTLAQSRLAKKELRMLLELAYQLDVCRVIANSYVEQHPAFAKVERRTWNNALRVLARLKRASTPKASKP